MTVSELHAAVAAIDDVNKHNDGSVVQGDGAILRSRCVFLQNSMLSEASVNIQECAQNLLIKIRWWTALCTNWGSYDLESEQLGI